MKKRILCAGLLIGLLFGMNSCCDCIHCPDTGSGAQDICKDEYEASGASAQITWQNYSTNLVNYGGCSCR